MAAARCGKFGRADQNAETRWTQRNAKKKAFTLLEMLVVLGILGMITALSLPYMKGINRSNTMAAATRQLLDDIEFARHRATSGRTTVYMVFIPPPGNPADAGKFSGTQYTNMLTGQYNSYALYTRRAVGEQPGQDNPRYLMNLRRLPDGIYIASYKFSQPVQIGMYDQARKIYVTNTLQPFLTAMNLPIPTVDGPTDMQVPYIAFDYQGRLVREDGNLEMADAYIPLARGSMFYGKDANGLLWEPADERENPPNNSLENYNVIHIDWLTGRAKVERPEIQ